LYCFLTSGLQFNRFDQSSLTFDRFIFFSFLSFPDGKFPFFVFFFFFFFSFSSIFFSIVMAVLPLLLPRTDVSKPLSLPIFESLLSFRESKRFTYSTTIR